MNYQKLKAGEIICPDCEGTGFKDRGEYDKLRIFFSFNKCETCWGSGKLDWIENIVGKEKPEFGFDTTSFTCTNLTRQPKVFKPDDVQKYIKGMRNSNVLLTTEIPDMVVEKVAKELADRIDANLTEALKKSFLYGNWEA